MKRLPIGLTVAVALALAVLVGLGAWQLQRLAEKSALLARIAALQTAPPRALEPVLAAAARGDDVAYTRVATDCTATTTRAPIAFRYALRDGRVGWRLLGVCALPPGGAYDGILLDRGLVVSLGGLMAPRAVSFPPPRSVIGVLRTPGAGSFLDRPASQGPDGATAPTLKGARSHARQKLRVSLNIIGFPGQWRHVCRHIASLQTS